MHFKYKNYIAFTTLTPILSMTTVPLPFLLSTASEDFLTESLALNSIGSITTRPSDPYPFAYKAKRRTLGAVPWLTRAMLARLYKGCKPPKACSLNSVVHLVHVYTAIPRVTQQSR